MAEEHGFGPDFDNSYKDYSDEMENVTNLENEYKNDPSPANLNALNEAKEVAKAKATVAFKDAANNMGVDPEVMGSIDWSRDLTAEAQPDINTAGETAELGRIVEKNTI